MAKAAVLGKSAKADLPKELFAEPFLITNRGGPGGGTETLGLFLYRQGFTSLNFGYASAVAYTMAGLASLISLVNMRLGRERP